MYNGHSINDIVLFVHNKNQFIGIIIKLMPGGSLYPLAEVLCSDFSVHHIRPDCLTTVSKLFDDFFIYED